MSALNTYLATINELATGYFLNRERWFLPDGARLFKEACAHIPDRTRVTHQVERARAMAGACAREFLSHEMASIDWVAQGSRLYDRIPRASKAHPADLLVTFTSTTSPYMGLSCKSTNGPPGSEVALKNPGIGALEKTLRCNLRYVEQPYLASVCGSLGLSSSQETRKQEIRDRGLQSQTHAVGRAVLSAVVTELCEEGLATLGPDALARFVAQHLCDCDTTTFPPYLRVTGYGSRTGAYRARVFNPLARTLTDVTWTRVAPTTVKFTSAGRPVCLLRAKYESEMLASTLKFSVDPV
jgi:hypothetical protein